MNEHVIDFSGARFVYQPLTPENIQYLSTATAQNTNPARIKHPPPKSPQTRPVDPPLLQPAHAKPRPGNRLRGSCRPSSHQTPHFHFPANTAVQPVPQGAGFWLQMPDHQKATPHHCVRLYLAKSQRYWLDGATGAPQAAQYWRGTLQKNGEVHIGAEGMGERERKGFRHWSDLIR
jgi:hypothetical protein